MTKCARKKGRGGRLRQRNVSRGERDERRTTIESHRSSSAGNTRASHNLGFSPRARRRLTRPVGFGTITPASIASSMRCLKRRRRIKERRMIADETNNNRKRVARKVNLVVRVELSRQAKKNGTMI